MECLFKFGVVCLMCIVSCYGMSPNEIEDFSNFLEKTSKLDQNVKSFNADDDDHISDDAWEESGKFEGDLILNERQRKAIVEEVAEGLSKNGLNDITKRWPNNMLIYYIQREHFNSEQVQAIESGLEDLARVSCVKFRPYKKGDRDAVVIQGSRRGCFSQVGYQGGYQLLNLNARHPAGRGCFRAGTIVHELLHSLGFYHMQSSPDRDDYIDVKWENIHEPARHNFKKYNSFSVSDFGVGYDYDSVLHYGRKAFSNNGKDTLVPKQSGADIGQRLGLSDKDTQKLNKMYCDADSNNFDEPQSIHHKPILKIPHNKKKKHKNQPFAGHGIGYHQGKTIAIKLPNAKTMQLLIVPAYFMYDYSRRAHQALPKTPNIQGFGAGKEVTKTFEPFKFDVPTQKKNDSLRTDPQKFTDLNMHLNSSLNNNTKAVDNYSDIDKSNETKDETSDENSGNEDISEEINHAPDEDVERAFNKFKQLFNDRSTSENDYRVNTDYNEFYNPTFKDPSTTSISVTDLTENTDVNKREKGEEHDLNSANMEKVQKYINNLHKPETSIYFTLDEHKTGNQKDVEILSPDSVDASYRTSYPFRQLDFRNYQHNLKSGFKYNPTNKLLVEYHYGDVYYPVVDTKTGSSIKAHKDIFGKSSLPFEDTQWYRREELNDTPLRYNKDTYTYYSPKEREGLPENIKNFMKSDAEERSNEKSEGYTIFGDPVPTYEKWYKEQPLVTDVLYKDKSTLLPSDASSEEHI